MHQNDSNIEDPRDLLAAVQEMATGRGGCIKLRRRVGGHLQIVGDPEGIMRLGALLLRFGIEGRPDEGTTLHVITCEDVFDAASQVRTVEMVLDERTPRPETGTRAQKCVGSFWNVGMLLVAASLLFAGVGFVVLMRALLGLVLF